MNNAILPDSFRQYYTNLLGEKEAENFFHACQIPLRKSIRINTLKVSPEKFLSFAQEKCWELSEIPWCKDGFWIDRQESNREIPLGRSAAHQMGLFYIQEASSMLPVEALFWKENNIADWKVLDMAASPGSKSTHISANMQGKGLLVANELSASRTKKLFSNLERCGVQNAILTHYDANVLCNNLPETFDAILLDAPCTGEGTVRKDPSALEYWKEENILKMAKLQGQLLRSAYVALKPNGVMVYSTCTLSPEEDEYAVQKFLDEFSDMEIVPLGGLFAGAEQLQTREGFLKIFPHVYDAEGFFVAKLRKKGEASSSKKSFMPRKNFPFDELSQKETKRIWEQGEEVWGFSLQSLCEGFSLWKREKTVWAFPPYAEEIFARVRCDRIGIPLFDQHEKKLRFTHEFVMAFGEHFQKNVYEVSEPEIPLVFTGKDLELRGQCISSEMLLRFQGHPLSLGKCMQNRWKNSYPRVNVREGVEW